MIILIFRPEKIQVAFLCWWITSGTIRLPKLLKKLLWRHSLFQISTIKKSPNKPDRSGPASYYTAQSWTLLIFSLLLVQTGFPTLQWRSPPSFCVRAEPAVRVLVCVWFKSWCSSGSGWKKQHEVTLNFKMFSFSGNDDDGWGWAEHVEGFEQLWGSFFLGAESIKTSKLHGCTCRNMIWHPSHSLPSILFWYQGYVMGGSKSVIFVGFIGI